MVERIKMIISWKKLSASAFADRIGVPRSTISHILSGRNNPSLDLLQKILDTFPEVRTEWLVRGNGRMLSVKETLFDDDDFEAAPLPLEGPRRQSAETSVKVPENETGRSQNTDSIPQNTDDIPGLPAREPELAASDEDTPVYRRTTNIPRRGSHVIIFYGDGTFREYFPRDANVSE